MQIQAFYVHGRWLIKCPKCKTLLPAWETGVICPREYPGMLAKALLPIKGGLFRPVTDVELVEQASKDARAKDEEYFPIFPDEKSEIERVLRLRPETHNLNWKPGETLDDLLTENRRHGVASEEEDGKS